VEFSAKFNFYGSLVLLLTCSHREGELRYRFSCHPAIKDSIEACGIPHTEVDLILVGDRSVDFKYQLQDDDQVIVCPIDFSIADDSSARLSPAIPDPVHFILDVHLGKLTRRLRLLGFDCLYRNNYDDREIIRIALEQQRIVLTCDRGILKQSCVEHGLLIRSRQVEEQVDEVLNRYRLHKRIRPLQRCPLCNGLLQPVEKKKIVHLLLPKTVRYCKLFHQCRTCGKLYWQGAHYKKISYWIKQLQRAQKQ
jgi:uncharacterized protein with PIN domain